MFKHQTALVVGAASVAASVVLSLAIGSFIGQNATGAVKYQTFNWAVITARHAYEDEVAETRSYQIPQQLVTAFPKLGEALQGADLRWSEMQKYCSITDCRIVNSNPIELTHATELTKDDLANVLSQIPFSYSLDNIEDVPDSQAGTVMTKFHQVIASYNGQNYVITVRSSWT